MRGGMKFAVLGCWVFLVFGSASAGGATAALGSAFAGFLTKDGHRRAAALLGALGAVITVLPKTLPDKEALQAHLSAAEKHRVLGSKIRNQLGFAQPGESVIDAEK